MPGRLESWGTGSGLALKPPGQHNRSPFTLAVPHLLQAERGIEDCMRELPLAISLCD